MGNLVSQLGRLRFTQEMADRTESLWAAARHLHPDPYGRLERTGHYRVNLVVRLLEQIGAAVYDHIPDQRTVYAYKRG